jgi:hypothetical protein
MDALNSHEGYWHDISAAFQYDLKRRAFFRRRHMYVYTIPYVTFEILQINIVIIVGWVILIAVPIITSKIME